jgi:hypothetical protein
MLSAFIQDDLMDREINCDDITDMILLEKLFFVEFITIYKDIFKNDKKFWQYFRDDMFYFTKMVSKEKNGFSSTNNLIDDNIITIISGKAHLLKLSVVAICILSEKEYLLNAFYIAIDKLLYTLQILDDLLDWKDDLKNQSTNVVLNKVMEHIGYNDALTLDEEYVKKELTYGNVLQEFVEALHENAKTFDEIPLEGNSFLKECNLYIIKLFKNATYKYIEMKKLIKVGSFFCWLENQYNFD